MLASNLKTLVFKCSKSMRAVTTTLVSQPPSLLSSTISLERTLHSWLGSLTSRASLATRSSPQSRLSSPQICHSLVIPTGRHSTCSEICSLSIAMTGKVWRRSSRGSSTNSHKSNSLTILTQLTQDWCPSRYLTYALNLPMMLTSSTPVRLMQATCFHSTISRNRSS